IVSSGRSGTAMLHKLLQSFACVEAHHEYAVDIVQPLAVKRYLDLADAEEATRVLAVTHQAAVHYSETSHWCDSSNKLSWLIPELAKLMPQAKFVHLVRDGRKVAGSYFRKLGDECYDDRSIGILQAFCDLPSLHPAPPPEKKYWWPVPRKGDALSEAFRRFDQFERIAWHWAEINRVILHSLAALDPKRTLFVRLEELCENPQALQGLLHFLNLPYRDAHFELFKRPHNVNRPQDELLSEAQRGRFEVLAGAMMARLGYADRTEYVVNY
ncbi:MAG TPA: sulfotransferase, partial [Rhizomicrobium sp.]|nr:sulfotransferase [Rhizomicrobium sp.]